jgi:hypothetical protein
MSTECQFLGALPPYPGGKRRLLPAIFGLIDSVCPRASWPTLAFADPFLGGGAVALTAKGLGFGEVLANDLAARSVIVGRALLDNSTVRLTTIDVLQLIEAHGDSSRGNGALLERLPPNIAHFLDSAWAQAESLPAPKDDLVRLLLIKVLLAYFPLGLPAATDSWRIRDGDLDPITGRRLHHYLSRQAQLLQPSHLLKLAAKINAGVFPGEAHVSQEDVFRFLPGVQADVVYLDPPYGGTQSYERAFRLLDQFIGDDHQAGSSFSSRRPPIDELLDACHHIPVLVLSLGNALLDDDGVRALVARHRRVRRILSLPYRHYGAVASPSKRAANREVLVLGTLK